jgi:hypothetical protein
MESESSGLAISLSRSTITSNSLLERIHALSWRRRASLS